MKKEEKRDVLVKYMEYVYEDYLNNFFAHAKTDYKQETKDMIRKGIKEDMMKCFKDIDKYLSDLPEDQNTNFIQVVNQTLEEKRTMYMSLEKEEIIDMLLECQKLLGMKGEDIPSVTTITSTTYPDTGCPFDEHKTAGGYSAINQLAVDTNPYDLGSIKRARNKFKK